MQSVKQKIAWLWRNAERILAVVFFLTFSLNIRKVFLTPYSFLNGGFNEYMTMSFSWADLLMIGTIIIYNIKLLISQFKQAETSNPLLENVIQNKSIVIRNYYGKYVSRETFYLLIFLGWAGLSVFWSQYRPIATYRFLTLIEIVLFAAIVIKRLKNSQWFSMSLFALIFNGLFQSLLGIVQFVHNSSLGLHFLGESILGPNIDGVAKLLIDGEKHIRAYGTFPHPNILAGFLLIPLFLIITELIQRKLRPTTLQPSFIQEDDANHLPCAEKTPSTRASKVSHGTILGFIPIDFLWPLFFLMGLGFALTFSRSAFVGLFFGLLIYVILIACTQDLIKKLKNSLRILPLFFIVFTLIIIALLNTTSIFSGQSLQERKLFQYVSYETILIHPARGVGIGQFVLNEYQLHPNLESWQYQPVHNLYLLVFGELGAIGFFLLLLFLISIILRVFAHKKARGNSILTICSFCCIIFSFLIVSFFDHYFWDIKLGTIIFVIPLIFLRVTRKN